LANGACAQALDYTTASPPELAPVVAAAARRAARGTLFAAKVTWVYLISLAAAAPAAVVLPWLLLDTAALQLVVMLLALLAVGLLASLRGRVCAQALQRTMFATDGRATRLADVSNVLDHVFCATDLHAGEHVYFSPSFVYSYRFGVGTPDGVSLATIVQASAAFPGAFPAVWLRTAPYAFAAPAEPDAATTRRIALVDGGVYDNMGDQWAHGLANRRARLRPARRELPRRRRARRRQRIGRARLGEAARIAAAADRRAAHAAARQVRPLRQRQQRAAQRARIPLRSRRT
jgi:predicted acylesterase/phospholipase RssA